MIRRLLVVVALLTLPQAVYAQFPSQNISLPTFIIPASAVNGGGVISTTCLTWPLGTPVCEDAVNVLAQRNSTNAQRFNVANSYTSSTNNELFSVDWQTTANTAFVGTRTAATGTARGARFSSQDSSGQDSWASLEAKANTLPFLRLEPRASAAYGAVSTSGTGTFIQLGGAATSSTTSGSIVFTSILPIYNQASGTAANTDLLINRTPTAVGSGTQLLFDAQNNSVSKFSVSNTGLQTTTQSATAANVQCLVSTATSDDPTECVSQYRQTTTNNSATAIATFTIPTSTSTYIKCNVVARRTGGAAGTAEDSAMYEVSVGVKNTTGTVAEIAAETLTVIGESQANFTVTAAPSGATEVISVTGETNNNLTWHATCRTWAVNQ